MPLARAGITEADVLAYWKAQPFDLPAYERRRQLRSLLPQKRGDHLRDH